MRLRIFATTLVGSPCHKDMERIPYEVLNHILDFTVDGHLGYLVMTEVCKKWKEVIDERRESCKKIGKLPITLPFMKWAFQHKIPSSTFLFDNVRKNDWIGRFSEHDFTHYQCVLAGKAVLHENLTAIQNLISTNQSTDDLVLWSIYYDKFEIYTCLKAMSYSQESELANMILYGRINFIKWYVENCQNYGEVKEIDIQYAIRAENIEAIHFLLDNGWKIKSFCLIMAGKSNLTLVNQL